MKNQQNISRRMAILGASASVLAGGTALQVGATNGGYRETDFVATPGRVSGMVRYVGNGVPVPIFPVLKDQDICGVDDRSPKALRTSDAGTLADCVVEIKGVLEGKPWDPVFNNGKIYQIDCSFQPYVQIIRSEAFVDVYNLDSILHNIHAYEVFGTTRRSMFNLAQPRAGQVDRIDLNLRRGNLMMIDCNAHNWMASWIYTSRSPYLAVTGEDGKFLLPDIPPGRYVLSIWHPLLGEKSADLSIAPDADLNLDLALS